MEAIKPTLEQIKELLPKRTSLVYIDYRDSIDGQDKIIQRCLENQSLDPLYEESWDWFWDAESESIREYMEELCKDVMRVYEMEHDEAWELLEEYEDYLEEIIRDRDDSTPVKDMIRNSSDLTLFYDTGYEVEPESWCWSEKRVISERSRIKKHIGLKGTMDDKDIEMMIRQASYGGQLVIYFNAGLDEVCDKNPTQIKFDGFYLAIINTGNGSGDHCFINGKVSMPYNHENLFNCKSIGYSYTFEVCGMYGNWCFDTKWEFGFKEVKKPTVAKSPIVAQQKQQAEYDKIFRAGGCSAGDMNITRHRHTSYINNYPCGTKCSKCGTFWID